MTDELVVALSADILEGGRVVIEVAGLEIGIFRIDGELYAWENVCAHAGGPVCQGRLVPRVVERLDDQGRSLGDFYSGQLHIVCPWHGFEYDIRTGTHPGQPKRKLRRIDVVEQRGEVVVRL